MGITTKNGDGGMSSLIKTKNIPKSDERFHLLGSMDELTSHLGLVKSQINDQKVKEMLTSVQVTLITVMAGIAEPHNIKHRLDDTETEKLEGEMQRLGELFTMPAGWAIPGGNMISANVDIARTIARRCERYLSAVTIKYGSDKAVKKYLNRMSDYLFTLARYMDVVNEEKTEKRLPQEQNFVQMQDSKTVGGTAAAEQMKSVRKELKLSPEEDSLSLTDGVNKMEITNEMIIQEVLKRMGQPGRIPLSSAKKLIDRVEQYSKSQGLNAVLAVCGPDGNPIAVHVMDGAFLVSFDVAVKKAYTAASVKMSTMELGELIKPGATFQGLDNIEGDKMVFFGGGVPLMSKGQMIGALGVSGGTGEQDNNIAQFGLDILEEILNEG